MVSLVLAALGGYVGARSFDRWRLGEPLVGASSGPYWIHSAIRRPGQLHRDLGIPEGQRIPHDLKVWASNQPGALGQRGRLALTLEGLSHSRRR